MARPRVVLNTPITERFPSFDLPERVEVLTDEGMVIGHVHLVDEQGRAIKPRPFRVVLPLAARRAFYRAVLEAVVAADPELAGIVEP